MDCREQLTYKILEKLVKEMPILEVDYPKQLEIKNVIANEIYEFEITSKCQSLVTSDLSEWIAYWLACKKMKNLSDSTIKNYTYLMEIFKASVVKPVRMINTMDIRRFMHELKEKGNSSEVICNKMMTLQNFFDFCKEEGAIEKNPCSRVEKPKYVKNPRKALKPMQQEVLRNACVTPRQKILYEILLSSGLRVNEACNVKLEDIDFSQRTIFVRCGKGGKSRTVKFSTKCKLEIELYLKSRKGDSEYLFSSTRKPYGKIGTRAMQQEMNKIKSRTDITEQVCCHKLRTTLAVNSISRSVSITSIQKLLGHENVNTTLRYAQTSNEVAFNDYNKVYD